MRPPSRARLALRAVTATAVLLPLLDAPAGAVDPRPPDTMSHRVWYVDNTAGQEGDGSQVAPFERLSRAARVADVGDTIYVFHGDGSDRGLDEGIRLRPYQHLVGAGVAFTTGDGDALPAGEPPVISARQAPTVTVAEHSSVEGLTLVGSAGSTVVAAREVSDVRLAAIRVEARGSTSGIELERVARATLEGVTVASTGRRALLATATHDLTLHACHLELEGGVEGDAALALRDPLGIVNVEGGEILAGGGAGVRLDAVEGELALRLQNVTLGASATAGETPVRGLDLRLTGNTEARVTADHLMLAQPRGAGLAVALDGGAHLHLEVTGSGYPDPLHPAGTAVQADARGDAQAVLLLRGNDLLATDMGAMLSASGRARLQALLDTNTIAGPSPARGIVLLLGDRAEGALTLARNHLSSQRAEAVYVVAAAQSRLGLDAHDNQVDPSATLTASPVPSLLVETRDTASACAALHDNRVGDGSGGGPSLALRQVGDSSLALAGVEEAAAPSAGQRMAGTNRVGRIEIEMRPGRTLASPAALGCPVPPPAASSAVAQE